MPSKRCGEDPAAILFLLEGNADDLIVRIEHDVDRAHVVACDLTTRDADHLCACRGLDQDIGDQLVIAHEAECAERDLRFVCDSVDLPFGEPNDHMGTDGSHNIGTPLG